MTKNFALGEFAVSGSYPHLIKSVPTSLQPNVRKLAIEVLQPVRDIWGRPIRITSGYRSPELNKAVGGSPTSQHLQGAAADFTTEKLPQMFMMLMGAAKGLRFGQCILYPDRNFIHIALPSTSHPKPRFQVHAPAFGLRYLEVTTVEALSQALAKAK